MLMLHWKQLELCKRSMEKTLIILKPDCIEKRLVGRVIQRFEEAGFKIAGSKMLKLNGQILREHYAHIVEEPFYPEIEQFMSSTPVIVLALEGENIIQKVRDLLGPTDSQKAPKGTIRGDYGTSIMKNVVHASDSPENAHLELNRFFKEDEIF
jgi:nucleoside-diphosphate kinase